MSQLYVIFGKEGRVSRKLSIYLNCKKMLYFNISWKNFCEYGIKKFLDIENFNKILLDNKISFNNIIFIDCFIGDFLFEDEAALHLRLLEITKLIYPNSKFVYLSTYEPHLAQVTKYRKMKFYLESILLERGSKILRIGNPILPEELEETKSYLQKFDLKSFSNKNILVPYTNLVDFFSILANLSDIKIYRCYSGYMNLSLLIFPLFKLSFLKSKSRFKIYIPLKTVNFLCLSILGIIKFFRLKMRFIIALEKPISLIAQQEIIFNDKNLINLD